MSDVIKIYVAGASCERERARLWMDRLTRTGFQVVSKWCETIDGEQHGVPNPPQALHQDRERWAEQNIAQVEAANVIWLLYPMEGNFSHGALFEAGFAYADGTEFVSSGRTTHSVFPALGVEFPEDELAYNFLCEQADLDPVP